MDIINLRLYLCFPYCGYLRRLNYRGRILEFGIGSFGKFGKELPFVEKCYSYLPTSDIYLMRNTILHCGGR